MNADQLKLAKGRVVKDGEVLRVPLTLMDHSVNPDALAALRTVTDGAPAGPLHRPGSLPMTDAARILRDGARADRIERINDAWRNPAPLDKKSPATQGDVKPDPMAAYSERCARLQDAWKMGGR